MAVGLVRPHYPTAWLTGRLTEWRPRAHLTPGGNERDTTTTNGRSSRVRGSRQPSIYYSERVNKTWSSRTGGRTDVQSLLCPFYGALKTHSKARSSALGHPLMPDYAPHHHQRGPVHNAEGASIGRPHSHPAKHNTAPTFPVTHQSYLLPRQVSTRPSVRLCKKGAICCCRCLHLALPCPFGHLVANSSPLLLLLSQWP